MRLKPYITKQRLAGLFALSAMGALAFATVNHRASHQSTAATPSAAQIALGQRLFNDSHLSADGSVRCASCHIPEKAYTDGRPVAIGIRGQTGTRNTPSLLSVDVSGEQSFFWDGRRAELGQAVLDPLTNPVEMGLHDQAQLIQRIEQNPMYAAAFAQAFPDGGKNITTQEVSVALVAYVRSLRPAPSAFDRYHSQGDRKALDQRALLGLGIFQGKGRCAECHLLQGTPTMLTDHGYHRTGVGLDAINQNLPALTQAVMQRSLQGSAIGNRVATHADEAQLGRFNITQDPADIGLFRTPSLRGVASTAPYMHDGSVATLDEAIDREVYYRSLQAGRPLSLTVEERLDLKAFLQAL